MRIEARAQEVPEPRTLTANSPFRVAQGVAYSVSPSRTRTLAR